MRGPIHDELLSSVHTVEREESEDPMVPWLVAGAITLVVVVAAAIVVFRVVVMAADVEMDDGELDDREEFDSQWRAVRPAHSH